LNRSCCPISRYDAQSHPANSSSWSAGGLQSDSMAVPIARVLLDPLNTRVLQRLGQGELDHEGITRDATEASEAYPAHDGYAAPGGHNHGGAALRDELDEGVKEPTERRGLADEKRIDAVRVAAVPQVA
jgi:hypothetical protein